ncbi:MAG: 4Fe-4S binding protein [Candidatus Krumholzibacteria bacterium]|nr:4Fe-4S binding protein [Candidatus Krumholzibacteria bacterium]MDH5270750.1 4Fe-4S binding protein [Candidatus Krumholzibacteria bacterium]
MSEISVGGDGSAEDRHEKLARLKPYVLPKPALAARRWRIERMRLAVQLLSLAVVVWIGFRFVRWVARLQAGDLAAARPPGVEGFLPISSLITLRHWLESGELSRVHPAGLVILLLAIGTGLLLKKAFCSWICPVGFVSETLAGVGRRLFRRKIRLPRGLDWPLRGLKYLLLAFFVYSIFVSMKASDIAAFLNSPYNRVADIKMMLFFANISAFALKVMAVLVALSVVIPFFWCRFLCPYGALLGLFSLVSPLKITRTASRCIDCGLCARACPAGIGVDRARRVRSDECTACLSCVAACPVPVALQVETRGPWRRAVRPALFAALVVLLFYGGIQVARLSGYWASDITNQEYQRRIQEIDAPAYHHNQGQVPPDERGD